MHLNYVHEFFFYNILCKNKFSVRLFSLIMILDLNINFIVNLQEGLAFTKSYLSHHEFIARSPETWETRLPKNKKTIVQCDSYCFQRNDRISTTGWIKRQPGSFSCLSERAVRVNIVVPFFEKDPHESDGRSSKLDTFCRSQPQCWQRWPYCDCSSIH